MWDQEESESEYEESEYSYHPSDFDYDIQAFEPKFDPVELKVQKKSLKEELLVCKKVKGSAREVKKETFEELNSLIPNFLEKYRETKLPFCSIVLLRSVRFNPPKVLKLVLEAICTLKGIGPIVKKDSKGKTYMDTWTNAQKLLSGNLKVELEDLRNPGNLCFSNVLEFQEKFRTNPEFNRDKIKRAFPPAAILYDWILSIEAFAYVCKEIEEKEIKWYFAQILYREQEEQGDFLKSEISRVYGALDYLQSDYDYKV